MPGFIKKANGGAGTKPKAKPRSKRDAKARAEAFYEDLQVLADQEEVPSSLTAADIQKILIPSSYRSYAYTMRMWKTFVERQLKETTGDEPFTSPPTVYRIKMYLCWFARSRTGLLEDNITDTTLRNRLASLKRAIRLHTNHKYSEADNEALNTYIHQDLVKSELLSTAAKPKPIAPLPVAEDLNLFSWACDEYQGMHSRMRVQLSFGIILMSALGTRPGEFIESDAWKKTNEGLLYDDVEFIRQDDEEYTGYLLKVRLRNRKGHRDNDKHAPQLIMYEEPTMRSMCPVLHFACMALADGAFTNVNTFEDIRAHRIPRGSDFYTFKCEPFVKNKPIMRATNPDGTISDDRILSYDAFNNALKGLGQRAGYEENMGAYCFRRAYARSIIKTATPQQSQMLMGHRGADPMGFYISGVVGIDSQSMVRGRPQRVGLLEKHTSMMAKRNLFAPPPPGSQLVQSTQNMTESDGEQVMGPTNLTPSEHYEIRRQSRNKSYRKEREEFFESDVPPPAEAVVPQRSASRYLRALWKFDSDREALVNLMFLDGKVDHGAAVELETIIAHMVRIASPGKRRYFYKSAEPLAGNICPVCTKKLDSYVCAPFPLASLTAVRKRPARANTHLLQCTRQRLVKDEREHMTAQFDRVATCLWHGCGYRFHRKTCVVNAVHITKHLKSMQSRQCLWADCLQVFSSYETLAYHVSEKHGVPNDWTMLTKMHYCYEHDLWCRSDQQWTQHVKMEHFLRLNDFCGLIRQAGVIVVAAHCLFCLGDTTLPVTTRFTQYPDMLMLQKHMKQHLAERDSPLTVCPHPRCADQLDSESGFWRHANSIHGSPAVDVCAVLGKRKFTCEEDSGPDTCDARQESE